MCMPYYNICRSTTDLSHSPFTHINLIAAPYPPPLLAQNLISAPPPPTITCSNLISAPPPPTITPTCYSLQPVLSHSLLSGLSPTPVQSISYSCPVVPAIIPSFRPLLSDPPLPSSWSFYNSILLFQPHYNFPDLPLLILPPLPFSLHPPLSAPPYPSQMSL